MRLLTLLTLLACRSKGPADDATTEPLTEDPPADGDGDGYDTEADCDDGASGTFPGAPEICDGVDNDCDGTADEEVTDAFYADSDGDGFGDDAASTDACEAPEGYAAVGGDCDDADAENYPGAAERCDEADNDCDALVDEEVLGTWYADADGDTYGDPGAAVEDCDPDTGYVADHSDCDDTDPGSFPGAEEVCDEADNDCDGDADEGVTATYYADVDSDGFGEANTTTESCDRPTGYAAVSGDCDDAAAAINPSADEVCDGADNDCDGAEDEAGALGESMFYADSDGDGYGDAGDTLLSCEQPAGYVADDADCDDDEGGVNPGAAEVCDLVDQDCDGQADDGVQSTFYADSDGDGYGDPGDSAAACDVPAGYVANKGDCDDADAALSPDTTWYLDSDGDGYGGTTTLKQCLRPSSYVSNSSDCDDGTIKAYPGRAEACDLIDNDCDSQVDEGVESMFYADSDGDGFGDPASATQECAAPSGYVADDTDCDDDNDDAWPGETEVCDGADNDCDGDADEDSAADALVWYADSDGDSFGDAAATDVSCDEPAGYVADDDDCDDDAAAVNPAATEICDGIDNDCASGVDEDSAADAATWYADADLDGYGDPSSAQVSCEEPGGGEWLASAGDCDDADADINPLESEACDGIDNDCDGAVDNDEAVLGASASCAATSCNEIATLRADAPDGTYYVSPSGGSAVTVLCEMDIDGGGWTQARQGYVSALPSGVTREYLYSYGAAWYRSPPTTAIWNWSSYQALNGTYYYSTGSLTATGSFGCSHGEGGHWGVGCSNGPGGQFKVLPIYASNSDQGTSTICQDRPDVFGIGACRTGAQIWVRP